MERSRRSRSTGSLATGRKLSDKGGNYNMPSTELSEEETRMELELPVHATPKPKERSRGRDGVFWKNHKYWISFTDGQGRRQMQPTSAPTLTQARGIRAAELLKAEKQRRFGYTEPTK